jgi:MFS transporter, SP family, sugar:H+ symporter
LTFPRRTIYNISISCGLHSILVTDNLIMAPNHDSLRANWKCIAACVLVSMSPFQCMFRSDLTVSAVTDGFRPRWHRLWLDRRHPGYNDHCPHLLKYFADNVAAMVGFMEVFGVRDPKSPTGWNITPEFQQLIGSLMTLGAVVASGLAGPLAWKLGRRDCLWIACVLCWVADIVMMVSTSDGALYFARLLIGLANGLFMTFSQLYIQECSPAQYRGLMLSAFQFWTSIGTLIGTIVDNFTAPLKGKAEYLIPLGLIYIVPVFVSHYPCSRQNSLVLTDVLEDNDRTLLHT